MRSAVSRQFLLRTSQSSSSGLSRQMAGCGAAAGVVAGGSRVRSFGQSAPSSIGLSAFQTSVRSKPADAHAMLVYPSSVTIAGLASYATNSVNPPSDQIFPEILSKTGDDWKPSKDLKHKVLDLIQTKNDGCFKGRSVRLLCPSHALLYRHTSVNTSGG